MSADMGSQCLGPDRQSQGDKPQASCLWLAEAPWCFSKHPANKPHYLRARQHRDASWRRTDKKLSNEPVEAFSVAILPGVCPSAQADVMPSPGLATARRQRSWVAQRPVSCPVNKALWGANPVRRTTGRAAEARQSTARGRMQVNNAPFRSLAWALINQSASFIRSRRQVLSLANGTAPVSSPEPRAS
jgi:hypothetical protein